MGTATERRYSLVRNSTARLRSTRIYRRIGSIRAISWRAALDRNVRLSRYPGGNPMARSGCHVSL